MEILVQNWKKLTREKVKYTILYLQFCSEKEEKLIKERREAGDLGRKWNDALWKGTGCLSSVNDRV